MRTQEGARGPPDGQGMVLTPADEPDNASHTANSDVAMLRAACAGRRLNWLQEYSQAGAAVRSLPTEVDPKPGSAGTVKVADVGTDNGGHNEQLSHYDGGGIKHSGAHRDAKVPFSDGIQRDSRERMDALGTGTAPLVSDNADETNRYEQLGANIEATRGTHANQSARVERAAGDDQRDGGDAADPHSGSTGEFLSLNDVDMSIVRDNNSCLKAIFDVVACSGNFNFRAARIPLPSDLNIAKWRSELMGYSDYGIVEYLEYGWPIGINRDAMLRSQWGNHPSAMAHQRDVDHYVATELGHRALLGPFEGPPTSSFHLSPLMTRPKRGSLFRRVIVDLSWPEGFSVNDGISKRDYIDGPMTISLPTTDDMERAVVRAGRGAFLYKTDLSRGYRQLRVDPLDWPFLSFQHRSNFYMDICPPFGLRSSAMAMQRVSQAIIHLHERRGFYSKAYIDDFGGVEPVEDEAMAALSTLQAIMDELGVRQAESKICLPSQVMIWLGICFDTREMSMAIPGEKMGEIMACVREWTARTRATRKDMQSLLGLLNFVASVAPPVRLFTNRILEALRESTQRGANTLSCQFKQDILFFAELLPMFNGRKMMLKAVVPYQHQVELDACLTGCGAVAGEQFYATPFPDHVLRAEHTIAHLEMLNIVVAIKVWRHRWSGWTVQVFCDNLNSVHVLRSGRSRDCFMQACAREVFLHTAACDIDVHICHRPGVAMVWADALSREHTDKRYADQVRDDPHLSGATRLTVPTGFFNIKNTL